jgi:hypothetical protein
MKPNNRSNKNGLIKLLQIIAPFIIALGAIGSVVLVSLAGRHSSQFILQLLFDIWVFSPFGIMILIKKTSKSWPTNTQSILNCMTLFITVVSLIIYTIVNIRLPSTHLAFPFVIVPLLSWLIILIVYLIAKLMSRKIINVKETL